MIISPQKALFESYINVRHKVLGVELRPLCLRHFLWLEHFGSPLVTGQRTKLSDLEIAVIVCSSCSDDEIFERLEKPRRFWRWKNAFRDFPRELDHLLAYYNDYFALPLFYERDGEVRQPKIPHLLTHAASLIKSTGWSEETVFNMPIGKVIWLNISLGYLETGHCNIVSEAEQAAAEYLSKLTKEA